MIIGGSVVKPIACFYEQFTTNYLGKTQTMAASYVSSVNEWDSEYILFKHQSVNNDEVPHLFRD